MVVRMSLSISDDAFEKLLNEAMRRMSITKKYYSVSRIASDLILEALREREVKAK